MSKLKHRLIFTVVAFIISFGLIHFIVKLQVENQLTEYAREIEANHLNIADRFRLFLESPLAIGITTSAYYANDLLTKDNYERLAFKTLNSFNELISLSLLDVNGKIIRGNLLNHNVHILGKISQNINELNLSLLKKEPYWLSPPFKLYLGPKGFTFYVPTYKMQKHIGWVAPVISRSQFFNKFIGGEFLKTYHLIIKDSETGKNYFETTINQSNKTLKKSHSFKTNIFGRDVIFYSWRRVESLVDHAHWPLSFMVAIVLTIIVYIATSSFQQKSSVKKQLEDINSLLKITVREATKNLYSIHQQILNLRQKPDTMTIEKINDRVTDVTNTIQQISLLQSLPELQKNKETSLVLLETILTDVERIVNKKIRAFDINLQFKKCEFKNIQLKVNVWLFAHSVIANILYYFLKPSPTGSVIEVSCSNTLKHCYITFKHFRAGLMATTLHTGEEDTGIYMAKKVIQLYGGSLKVLNSTSGSEIITVMIPMA